MPSLLARITPLRFFLFILGFSLFGLVLIYDVSVVESLQTFGHPWHFATRHSIWIALGIVAFGVCATIPAQIWKKLAPWMFWLALALLVAVLIPGVGRKIQGAQRWIYFGSFGIQPAEMTKLAIILFFASWLDKHQRFAPFLMLTGVVFTLIMLQPNLSTAGIVALLCCFMYFLAGGSIKPLVIFGGIGAVIISLLIFSAPYRRERLVTFLNPASDPLGKSYHIRQITLALGRGGIFGQGIGLSKQKQEYIPEASSDSIFSIYAEETGFVGSVLLMSAYAALIKIGWETAKKQEDRFRMLVCAGITTWICLHVVLNLSAMAALIPLTGIPLPLISFGGSNYLSFMAGLGILAGMMRSEKPATPKRRALASRRASR
jgi:cell division protein FtsW